MQFVNELKTLLVGFFLTVLIIILSALYWAVFASPDLNVSEVNPRKYAEQIALIRGNIYDRNHNPLVESNTDNERVYLEPATFGIIGYYSLQYGSGGIEGAYEEYLSGANRPKTITDYIEQDILHKPAIGSDIQVTLDLDIQKELNTQLEPYEGAGVVISTTGEVLAISSHPNYDPNLLDSNWDELTEATNRPFFNRAVQALYQPGGVLQTPLATAAITNRIPTQEVLSDAGKSVVIDGLEIRCATLPPSNRLTLSESYGFACPAPFADIYTQLGSEEITQMFNLFRLYEPVTLSNFLEQPETDTKPFTDISLINALGQGDITITPLHMAVSVAAMINEGNAPEPYMLLATRPPNSEAWTPYRTVRSTLPITTPQTSRQIQQLMREATISGGAYGAARSNVNIGGHASTAQSGNRVLTWFVGFVITGPNEGFAISLVLENVDDTWIASNIGGSVLSAAYNKFIGEDDES